MRKALAIFFAAMIIFSTAMAEVTYVQLKRNEKGDAVTNLQERLKELGYYTAKITGKFDTPTETAVKAFEKANGFKQDGVASIDEQKLLFSADAKAKPTPTPKPTKKPTPTPKPTRTPKPTATPVPMARALQLTKVSFRNNASYFSLSVTLKNLGEVPIGEFGLRYRFYNRYGERVYEYVNSVEGYADEMLELKYAPNKDIAARKAITIKESYAMYSSADTFKVALSYFRRNTGEYIHVEEDSLIWLSSDGTSETPYATKYYRSPSQSILTKQQSFALGITPMFVFTGEQTRLFYKNPGRVLYKVNEGSLSEKAGLKVNDMIVSIDGIKCAEDFYAIEKANAKMADGETVELVYERNGTLFTIEISKNLE